VKELLLFTFSLIIVAINIHPQDTIKIMPVGNSITAGEHYNEPDLQERTGYRKDLYEMLIDSGYIVDFVGSQTHGKRSVDDEDWYDWNNEAYPGWKVSNIADKVEIALGIYMPDILLVHVGTNGPDWNEKPGQVEDMLDMINDFSIENNHQMTVFLCKIINRFNGEHAPTTQFNNDVADAVAARTGDKIKIIMVDMENGAGLDYSDAPADPNANPPYEGGDIWGTTYPGVSDDLLHPNDKGNTKMAAKFYKEIVKELGSPLTVKY
jgi:lysophospholipase L1-like esterase